MSRREPRASASVCHVLRPVSTREQGASGLAHRRRPAAGWSFPRLASYYLHCIRNYPAYTQTELKATFMTSVGPGSSRPSKNQRREIAREKAKTLREEQKKKDRRNRVFLQGGIAVAAVAIVTLIVLVIV